MNYQYQYGVVINYVGEAESQCADSLVTPVGFQSIGGQKFVQNIVYGFDFQNGYSVVNQFGFGNAASEAGCNVISGNQVFINSNFNNPPSGECFELDAGVTACNHNYPTHTVQIGFSPPPPPDTTGPSITSPQNQTVTVGNQISITWTITDSSGISSVVVNENGTNAPGTVTQSGNQYTYTETANQIGNFTYTIIATDNSTQQNTNQNVVNVSVTPAPDTTGPSVTPLTSNITDNTFLYNETLIGPETNTTIQWRINDNPNEQITYTVFKNGSPISSNNDIELDNTGQGTVSYTVQVDSLTGAQNYFYIVAIDESGNSSYISDVTHSIYFNFSAQPNQPITGFSAGLDKEITLPFGQPTSGQIYLVGDNANTGIDPENENITYQWSFVSGPTTPTITNSNSFYLAFVTGLSPGTYIFRASATAGGLSVIDQIEITIGTTANQPPVVGFDATINGVTRTFTQDGTFDVEFIHDGTPGGELTLEFDATNYTSDSTTTEPLIYQWRLNNAFVGDNSLTLGPSTDTVLPNFNPNVSLTVTDSEGLSTTRAITINTTEPNQAPIIVNQDVVICTNGYSDAGNDFCVVNDLGVIDINITPNAYDPDDDDLTHQWNDENENLIAQTPNLTQSNLTPGDYTFYYIVTDTYGASTTTTYNVTINEQSNYLYCADSTAVNFVESPSGTQIVPSFDSPPCDFGLAPVIDGIYYFDNFVYNHILLSENNVQIVGYNLRFTDTESGDCTDYDISFSSSGDPDSILDFSFTQEQGNPSIDPCIVSFDIASGEANTGTTGGVVVEYVTFSVTDPNGNTTSFDKQFRIQDNTQYGCMDPEATNYDSDAQIDNGSCIYGIELDRITVNNQVYDIVGNPPITPLEGGSSTIKVFISDADGYPSFGEILVGHGSTTPPIINEENEYYIEPVETPFGSIGGVTNDDYQYCSEQYCVSQLFIYTHDGSENNDNIIIRYEQGDESTTYSIGVEIIQVDDAPVITFLDTSGNQLDNVTVNEDTNGFQFQINIEDPDSDGTFTIEASNTSLVRSIALSSSGAILFDNNTIEFRPYFGPSLSNLNTLSLSLEENQFGSSDITLITYDNNGAPTTSKSFTIEVLPIEDEARVFINGLNIDNISGSDLSTDEEQSITLTITSTDEDPGDFSLLTTQPIALLNEFNNTGTIDDAPATSLPGFDITTNPYEFTFTPNNNVEGGQSIFVEIKYQEYKADFTSGDVITKTFPIYINPVDDSPILIPIPTVNFEEDSGGVSFGLVGTDVDNEDTSITYSATLTNLSGEPFDAGYLQQPQISGNQIILNNIENLSGDNQYVTVIATSNGLDSLPSTFQVIVGPTDDIAVISEIGIITVDEDTSFVNTPETNCFPIRATDIDSVIENDGWILPPNDDDIQFGWCSANYQEQNPNEYIRDLGIITLNNFCGTKTYDETTGVKVTSNGVTTLGKPFAITVNCVDDAPSINFLTTPSGVENDVSYFDIEEDFGSSTIMFQLSDADVQHYIDTQETGKHPFDAINVFVSINNQSNPPVIDGSSLSTSINSTGELTLSFNEIGENRNGEANLTIYVSDPNNLALSDSISFTIKVNPVNDAPTIMDINEFNTINVNQGSTIQQTITANDIEGDEITDIQISADGNAFGNTMTIDDVTYTLYYISGESSAILEVSADAEAAVYDRIIYIRAGDTEYGEPKTFITSIGDIYTSYSFELISTPENINGYIVQNNTHPAGISESTTFEIYGLITLDPGTGGPTSVNHFNEENRVTLPVSEFYNVSFEIDADGYDSNNDGVIDSNIKFTITPNQTTIIENITETFTFTLNDDDVGGIKTSDITLTLLYQDCDGVINGDSIFDACGVCGGVCFDVGLFYGDTSFVVCDGNQINGNSANAFGQCFDPNGIPDLTTGTYFHNPLVGDWTNSESIIQLINSSNEILGSFSPLSQVDVNQLTISSIPSFPNDDLSDNLNIKYYVFSQEGAEPPSPFFAPSTYAISYTSETFQCCIPATENGEQIFALDGETPLCSNETLEVISATDSVLEINSIFEFALTGFTQICPDGLIEANVLVVYGCTDPIADNYDENANFDDGSCAFAGFIKIEPASAFGLVEDLNIYPVGGDTRLNHERDPNSFLTYVNPNYGGFMPLNLIGPYQITHDPVGSIHDEPYFDKPNEDFDLTLVGNIHPKVGCPEPIPGTSYKYTLIIEDYNNGNPVEILDKEFKWTNSNTDRREFKSFLNKEFIYSLPKSSHYNFRIEFETQWPYARFLTDQSNVSNNTVESTVVYPVGNIIGENIIQYDSKFYIYFDSVPIQQSLSSIYLPFQAIDINIEDYPSIDFTYFNEENRPYFQQDFNYPLGWLNKNQDKRKPLGCFNFKDENQNTELWPFDTLGDNFQELLKENIVTSDALEHVNTFDYETEGWKIPHIVDVDVRMYKRRGVSQSTLFHYWDKNLQQNNYDETTAPLDVQFYFYPRPSKSPMGNSYPFALFEYKDENLLIDDFKNGFYYLTLVDWGDGSPIEYDKEPLRLGFDVIARHNYERAGIYEITGYMLRVDLDENFEPAQGVVSNTKFLVRININEERENEFDYLGGTGYSFIPYENTTPIIGGMSENSLYYNSISRQLGILENFDIVETYFEKYTDRLNSQAGLYLIKEQTFTDINNYQEMVYDLSDDNGLPNELPTTENLIYNGLYDKAGELGSSIGFTDIQLPRFFNQPKQIWEMLGFEEPNISDFNDALGENLFNVTMDINNWNYNDWSSGNDLIMQQGLGEIIEGVSYFNAPYLSVTTSDLPMIDGDNGGSSSNTLLVTPLLDNNDLQIGETYIISAIYKANNTPRVTLTAYDENISLYTYYISANLELNIIELENGWRYAEAEFEFQPQQGVCDDEDNIICGYNAHCEDGVECIDYVDNTTYTNWTIYLRDGDNPPGSTILWANPEVRLKTEQEASEYYESMHPGNPSSPRYWNNIIPKNYDIYNNREQDGIQNWKNGYYYPVLPLFSQNRTFTESLGGKIPFGTPNREWNEDDVLAAVTNEQYQDDSLLLNYTSEYIERGVLEDTSGYDNVGMCMNDYRVEYDEQTIEPIKQNRKFTLIRGKQNKAF